MSKSTRPAPNGFVATMRKAYNPMGFAKGYNFTLFLIFTLAFTGFCAYSMPLIDVDKNFCGPEGNLMPEECAGVPRIGMFLHLAAILPAGVLACLQFLPVIRHKVMIVHRVNGYVVLVLSLIGAIGALMVTRNAFGGTLDIQVASGVLSIAFIGSMIMAYINIKRLQIEQHRAWMLRAWFYGGTIVTARPIMFSAAAIITTLGGYSVSRSCEWLDHNIPETDRMLELYPVCSTWLSGENPSQRAVVDAKWATHASSGAEVIASLSAPFGMAIWLAFTLHAFGVEIYLRLTPGETERLRKVSYQRQLAAGMKNPGRAGLTSDRLGDGPAWVPRGIESISTSDSDTGLSETLNASAQA